MADIDAGIAKPFTIDISSDKLDLLRRKLELTIFPDVYRYIYLTNNTTILASESDWAHGPPLPTMRRLVKYWRNRFDWKAAEARLNLLPQYTVAINVDGFGTLHVHYLHVNKAAKNAIPLLMVHGWPGSFFEFTKILGPLMNGDGDEPTFEIIVPSLIGYGFSDGAKEPGFGCFKQAEMCHKLMLKLGFGEYVVQGGDWGVCRHSFELPPAFFLTTWPSRPQTIGCSIMDSPVGLLGWILDKLQDWTDNYPWTDDEILTWVSIYWFSTSGPTASLRLYYESRRAPQEQKKKGFAWAKCPMGISHFPMDINVSPVVWSRPMGNFVFERVHTSGGHFAAWEKPDILAGDLKDMFKKGGPVYGVVRGRDGY
ncbi:hypothetical protein TWF103_007490 [Orbilia oligospora]|nr:hypothetical protein TWF103_007490 [Orbilia oligospora]